MNGYAINAARLPALLAEYRKYGSADAACAVRASQFCRSGAVVETTKNGIAVDAIKTESNCNRGCKENDSEDAALNRIGLQFVCCETARLVQSFRA